MRIAVHDYSGHPFQVQLSRELARRGHEVCHLHCASFVTGKGALEARTDDPPTFRVEAIDLGEPFAKYSFSRRLRHERRYARLLAERVAAFGPDVVLSSNTPLFAQSAFLKRLDRSRTGFVFWQQDVYSVAMANEVRKRVPVLGATMAKGFERLERGMLAASDEVVVISDDFRPILDRWEIANERVTTIENWAPLAELSPLPHDNAWAEEHDLGGALVILYSGTLGLKHNPELLVQLAVRTADRSDVRVVVISEGLGAEYLAQAKRDHHLDHLLLLPFQPYDRLAEVLSSADVLVAILEPDAGVFSVPSKVLTYHCAARPILASVPAENLAARIIEREGSGIVTDPESVDQIHRGGGRTSRRRRTPGRDGTRARDYAERTFDIDTIADRFEPILERAAAGSGPAPQSMAVASPSGPARS